MPSTQAREPRHRRRLVVAVAIVLLVLAIAAALLSVWVLFFANPAPAAPTLDDALQVLLPSAPPG
jgi:polyferredoxin